MEDYKVYQIAKNTWTISELSFNSMYLLTGSKYALLIDTGIGLADLNKVIRSLTTLPLIVVITHGHLDHAGGISNFDEIFIHPADINMMNEITVKMRQRFVEFLGSPENENEHILLNKKDCDLNIRFLSDGDAFDLGDRIVSVMETPGHSLGSVVLFDNQTRFLFSGDACNPTLLLDLPPEFSFALTPSFVFSSVETCLKSLLKIKSRASEFDCNYTGHIDQLGNKPADPNVLNDGIICCMKILDGTIKKNIYPFLDGLGMQECAMYGSFKIMYNENKLFD